MWVNRIAAALALASAVLHLRMGVTDATSAFVTAMALLCVYCAVDLLRSGGNRAWVMVAATSAGMLLAHSSFPTHHHTAVSRTSSMTIASAVAAAELVLAASVVFFRTRHVHPEFRPYRLQELR
ncbi:hypothetical protein [Rhodococcus sp. P1Y]|uniref:hypothetical protein n=1 Tax=Rhodococcus sp. P1Y TaxID=1302308 RepID=UPI000EB1586C|nr:hypothetical protein [Rhodococcus sp. P1Y]AYJ50521.1 hypothetical protein D8W71_22100 [Rhodococcus sp. P1Y]